MKTRMWTMAFLLLITGPVLADDRPTLGAPVVTPEIVRRTPPVVLAQFQTPPPAILAQFQTPVDQRPVRTPFDENAYPWRWIWVDCEALLWWMRSANLPPLITASPAGTPGGDVGVLGIPGTSVLFGGPTNGGLAPGGRVTAGYWFDDETNFAIEGYFFQLSAIAAHASAGSPGNVGRPFFNTATGLPDAQLVSLPGLLDGTVQASATSGSLLGAGVLARVNLFRDMQCRLDALVDTQRRLDALVGYRFLSLRDNIGVIENLTAADPAELVAPLGTNIRVADNFRTANYFHGGEIGLSGSLTRNAWRLEATARVALGATHERVEINGATSVTVPGAAPVTSQGGLLALSSNSGAFSRNVFAVAPEARIRLIYDLNPRTSLHVGYSFLYWSRVVRAGDQIDLVVNPDLLPPPVPGASPVRPAFTFHGTSFWAQGIDIGLDFRF